VLEKHALVEVGLELKALGYVFTAITPESHRRVLARNVPAAGLRDVFGWNRPFSEALLSPAMLAALRQSDVICAAHAAYVSQVRFATLYDAIYVHSGFPTLAQEAVFFGPDTYRYARWLRQHVVAAERVVDIGCGSGAGGLCLQDRVAHICLADINPQALRYARMNAEMLGIAERVECVFSDVLTAVQGSFDLVISNPPYMVDEAERAYRHGGDLWGAALSVRIVRESLARLAPGGQLVLYTASAIVDGVDTFWQAIQPLLQGHEVVYEEIDPDVFGEELARPVYVQVDRLAVVGLVVRC